MPKLVVKPRIPRPLTPSQREELRRREGGYASHERLTAFAAAVNARRLSR